MSPTHTPGPWSIGRQGWCVIADHPIEAGPRGADDVEYYGGHLICESVTPNNARLIAAAPELLEMLQSIENDDKSIPAAFWDRMQAVIVKAGGTRKG